MWWFFSAFLSRLPGAGGVFGVPAATGQTPWRAVWPLALWLAVAGNVPLWQRVVSLGGSAWSAWVLVGGLGLLVWGATVALLSLMVWSRVYRPVASLLVLVAGDTRACVQPKHERL